MRRRAFSLIELSAVIVMLAILSSLVVVNFTRSRQTARDGIRRNDVQALLTGINQFAQVNGSAFLRASKADKTLENCSLPTDNSSDPSFDAVGAGCVGAGGRGYGLVNVAGDGDTFTVVTGYGGSNPSKRQYTTTSIAQALFAGGYLSSVPHDPSAKGDTIMGENAGKVPDYAVIRACPNGEQHVGERGQLVAVWTILERGTTAGDRENLLRVVGSLQSGPVANYRFDFAAGTDLQQQFEQNGFGVSNGVSHPNTTGLSCLATNS